MKFLIGYPETELYFLELWLRWRGHWTSWDQESKEMTPVSNMFSNRLFEWYATSTMLGIALSLAVSPGVIKNSAFSYMLDSGLTQYGVLLLLLLFGAVRIAALLANGKVPVYGPIARALCAMGGAVMWLQFCLALLKYSASQGVLTPGVTVYFFMMVGEVFSCYRAAVDGRRHHKPY